MATKLRGHALALLAAIAADADDLLPYPRSQVPTGQAGPIFVISETSIPAKEDQVTLHTLAGVLARHSPRIYTIKSPTADLQRDAPS